MALWEIKTLLAQRTEPQSSCSISARPWPAPSRSTITSPHPRKATLHCTALENRKKEENSLGCDGNFDLKCNHYAHSAWSLKNSVLWRSESNKLSGRAPSRAGHPGSKTRPFICTPPDREETWMDTNCAMCAWRIIHCRPSDLVTGYLSPSELTACLWL